MWGRVLQVLGILLILASIGLWWLLDLYGCSFNTSGCTRMLPRLTGDAVVALAGPVGLGMLLFFIGWKLRRTQ